LCSELCRWRVEAESVKRRKEKEEEATIVHERGRAEALKTREDERGQERLDVGGAEERVFKLRFHIFEPAGQEEERTFAQPQHPCWQEKGHRQFASAQGPLLAT
jgi:hypothetical protein